MPGPSLKVTVNIEISTLQGHEAEEQAPETAVL